MAWLARLLRRALGRGRRSAGELWQTSFRWRDRRRLPDERGAAYAGRVEQRGYRLSLDKPRLFAWIAAETPRSCRDLRFTASFRFAGGDGHSAAGCLVRYVDDENFYYFLLSNRGYVRFDVVFNGTPRTLVGWTETTGDGAAAEPESQHDIEVVASDGHFVLVVDDECVAEVEDDTIGRGGVGIAAQNYDAGVSAQVLFTALALDARPLAVRRWLERWLHVIPRRLDSRLALARSHMELGNFAAAAVQLERVVAADGGRRDARLLLARCLAAEQLHEDAARHLDALLEAQPDDREALIERAGLYYVRNEFVATRDTLTPLLTAAAPAAAAAAPSAGESAADQGAELWNLLGNAEYALGNFTAAITAYRAACAGRDRFPLFHGNLARALERSGADAEALERYLRAAQLLFEQEAYEELGVTLTAIERLHPEHVEAQAYRAKVAFADERFDLAERLLQALLERGHRAPAVVFLAGLLRIRAGARDHGAELLAEAVAAEPDNYLFWFRYAETRYLQGIPFRVEAQRAAELAPEDPWCGNLVAIALRLDGDLEGAARELERARSAAPDDPDIAINQSELLVAQGAVERALEPLQPPDGEQWASAELARTGPPAPARVANQRGNVLALLGRHEQALADYEQALALTPGDADVLHNAVAACLEAERFMRGEELLARLLDARPDAAAYNLAGNLAARLGEYRRAEAAFREGLAADVEHPDLRANLIALYLEMEDYPRAKAELELISEESPRFLALRDRLRSKYERRIGCATCATEWWVPQVVPLQEALRVHGEPPPDAPAGRCAVCGQVYCVRCASEHVVDARLQCAECRQPLKLDDDALRYLLRRAIDATERSVAS